MLLRYFILFTFFFATSWSCYGEQASSIDLRKVEWGQGQHFKLDGVWQATWGELLVPDRHDAANGVFPVPGVWRSPTGDIEPFPSLGFMTYQTRVLLPDQKRDLYLYIPDMPSAYKLWANGKLVATNGTVGLTEQTETPGFLPQTVELEQVSGHLDILIQVSNFHYREGGIWFSLKLSDESGVFSLRDRPIIFAIFAGAVLIALGIYNCLLFAFRSQEVAALNFGLLCFIVGVRRLLIDERVVYMFDLFSWETLQRVEHLCFYVALPLFMGFFMALFPQRFRFSVTRLSWILTAPFILFCLFFPARLYTELNLAFQVLVLISVAALILMFVQIALEKGRKVLEFGISLMVLFVAVANDVLKANDLIDTPNIAHFGVFAFIVSQSIAFQRRYLKSLRLVETMTDQLKERNQELVRQDSFKDEFLANTSHELRTPLHGIAGLAKALQDHDESLTQDQKNKVDLIANTSKRLGLLVNDILDFSSIKHNKLTLNRGKVDLEALINVVLATVKPVLGNKTVQMSAQVEPEVRYVYADEYRLQQVLFNILGNAAKFTEQGFIRVHALKKHGRLSISVSDSGIGIHKEKQDTLFRPFEQAHVEGAASAGGTGLGLSISRQLIELHGGELQVESQFGKGTTVLIHLPEATILADLSGDELADVQLDLPKVAVMKESADLDVDRVDDNVTGPMVYVVDDEVVNRELVLSQLHDHGYRVETFHDGLSVLSRMNEALPDLVLLDYMMPKMNGIEVCETLRRQYDSFEVPVMMLTARHQISDIVKALGAGANDYLIKPYHDKELLARVESQLNARKFWVANKENQKLKNEIERREALEEALSEANTRLLNVLDVTEEQVLLLNSQLNVIYSNEPANQSFNPDGQTSLLGLNISSLVENSVFQEVSRVMSERDLEPVSLSFDALEGDLKQQLMLKCFIEKDAPYLALIINEITGLKNGDEANSAIVGLARELEESRKKIGQIEGALKQIYALPSESVPSVVDAADSNVSVVEPDMEKELLVSLHRMTLHLWERYSNTGKAELAEKSRCWRVYIDGTTVKTRTFDKYLSVKTMPDKPRWRPVVRTANYVLSSCELEEQERIELMSLVRQIEDVYT